MSGAFLFGARGCRRTHFCRSNPAQFFSLRRFLLRATELRRFNKLRSSGGLKKALNLVVAELQMARARTVFAMSPAERFSPNYQRR
jgi:hypothetical protein